MSNETIQSILERRSVRKFMPDMIKDEELQTILDCGLWAPSASNTQGWHISVIRSKEMIDHINQKLKEYTNDKVDDKRRDRILNPEYSVFFHAPLLLLLSYDEDGTGVWGPTNIGIMAENICIAAQSLGIGSLMVGMVYNMMKSEEFGKPICEKLELPEGYTPHMFICLGYPDASSKTAKKPRREGTVSYLEQE